MQPVWKPFDLGCLGQILTSLSAGSFTSLRLAPFLPTLWLTSNSRFARFKPVQAKEATRALVVMLLCNAVVISSSNDYHNAPCVWQVIDENDGTPTQEYQPETSETSARFVQQTCTLEPCNGRMSVSSYTCTNA